MDKVLNVGFQRQETSVWCWAAVGSMVSEWYAQQSGSAALSQCGVAAVTLSLPSCCSPSSVNPNCLRLWGLDQALSKSGHFAGSGGSPNLATVVSEINANRPIAAMIRYPGIIHFVLVTGYSDGQQLLVVCDPAGSQAFSTPISAFFSKYNNAGSWGGWYFTA